MKTFHLLALKQSFRSYKDFKRWKGRFHCSKKRTSYVRGKCGNHAHRVWRTTLRILSEVPMANSWSLSKSWEKKWTHYLELLRRVGSSWFHPSFTFGVLAEEPTTSLVLRVAVKQDCWSQVHSETNDIRNPLGLPKLTITKQLENKPWVI